MFVAVDMEEGSLRGGERWRVLRRVGVLSGLIVEPFDQQSRRLRNGRR